MEEGWLQEKIFECFFFYLNARLMYDFRVTVSIFLFVLII